MGWMYDPQEKVKFDCKLPIHSEDGWLGGFTYQEVVDAFRANTPTIDRTEKNLKKFIREFVNMKVEDMWDNYELVRENLLKEVQRRD